MATTHAPELTTQIIRLGHPQMFSSSTLQSIDCASGVVCLQWEQSGIPFEHLLFGGGLPWQADQVPQGTWVRVAVVRKSSATLVLQAVDAAEHQSSSSRLSRLSQLSRLAFQGAA